ncbi:MAG: tetratricopeptide repeat protein, partial [Alphaproteobacteria bacterium]|nr:tetratricopeptide repeat protein [Alphaproteobacteria bacterium]
MIMLILRLRGLAYFAAYWVGVCAVWLFSSPALVHADNERRGLDLFGRGQYAEALKAWERGAAKGDAGAAYRVATVYLNQSFSPDTQEHNQAKALAYLNQAAQAGEPRAELELASLYERGYGVSRNREEAQKLYMRAAQKGLPAAQFHIAKMLEEAGDFVAAYRYYLLAKWQAYLQAPLQSPLKIPLQTPLQTIDKTLANLAKRLSESEIKQATRQARDFIPQKSVLGTQRAQSNVLAKEVLSNEALSKEVSSNEVLVEEAVLTKKEPSPAVPQ